MDQSSDIVLDTPKVKLCTISNSVLLGYYVYSHLTGTVFIYCWALDRVEDLF